MLQMEEEVRVSIGRCQVHPPTDENRRPAWPPGAPALPPRHGTSTPRLPVPGMQHLPHACCGLCRESGVAPPFLKNARACCCLHLLGIVRG